MNRTLALALLAALAACQSAPPPPSVELPFHVALAPVLSVPSAAAGDEDDPLFLDIDAGTLTHRLHKNLEQRCFARVSRIPLTPEQQRLLPEMDRTARWDLWRRKAGELGADLILESRLTYDRAVETRINDRFWLNLPLFLFGGPACYFIDDRSYEAASLGFSALVYEASAPAGQLPSPLVDMDLNAPDINLDFIDRHPGPASYFLSLLVPAGLLARSSDGAVEALHDRLIDDLVSEVALRVVDRDRRILDPGENVHFFPNRVNLIRNGDTLTMEAELLFQRSRVSEGLAGFRMSSAAGDWLDAEEFGEPVPLEDGRLLYHLHKVVSVGSDQRTLRVEVFEDNVDGDSRSFTYELPESDTPVSYLLSSRTDYGAK